MKTTYQGGCHCGAVRFEAALDIADGSSRCNCSYCSKLRLWKADAAPHEMRLHRGAEMLTEYRFGSRAVLHQFCKACGVKLFGRFEASGQPRVVVSIPALDAPDQELAEAQITYQDGRHDRFDRGPAEIRYL
jgi:hypothetical protein